MDKQFSPLELNRIDNADDLKISPLRAAEFYIYPRVMSIQIPVFIWRITYTCFE
ncbi:hypothetical protein MMC2321_03915 [Chitinophaga sp. MM2321]